MKEGKEVGERGRERGEVDPPCAEQVQVLLGDAMRAFY